MQALQGTCYCHDLKYFRTSDMGKGILVHWCWNSNIKITGSPWSLTFSTSYLDFPFIISCTHSPKKRESEWLRQTTQPRDVIRNMYINMLEVVVPVEANVPGTLQFRKLCTRKCKWIGVNIDVWSVAWTRWTGRPSPWSHCQVTWALPDLVRALEQQWPAPAVLSGEIHWLPPADLPPP